MKNRAVLTDSSLRLMVLGTFRVERNGRPIQFPRRKMESLFAYLVLHQGPHRREKLAALFWGDAPDENAFRSLRVELTALYKTLGHDIILSSRDGVQIASQEVWADALVFGKAVITAESPLQEILSILDLYRGDLLSDFDEEWIIPEREYLRERYLERLEIAVESFRSRQEFSRAKEFASRILEIDSAHERAHQHLMFCYWALGDRTRALLQYQKCVAVLRSEFGIQPLPATTALFNRIKQTPIKSGSVTAHPTTLPSPLTSFIGRAKELRELRQLLPISRLVTLTGAGGSGKTRLALQVATEMANQFQDGVWWVGLDALNDESDVPRAILRVLGLIEVPGRLPITTITHYLRDKQALMLIDSCEHLRMVCAKLFFAILTQCPGIKILATSREPLAVNGEHIYKVPTLSFPETRTRPTISFLLEHESVQLFLARATLASPKFSLDDSNCSSVAHICRRLDGIPLAIELAAAKTSALTPQTIEQQIVERFRLLENEPYVTFSRHQTLRASLDWSFNLLSLEAQIFFLRLAMFSGSFSLEAAEQICYDETVPISRISFLLVYLADRSLVAINHINGQMRFTLLDTIRQYVTDKSEASFELRARHADFFANLAKVAEPKLVSAEREQILAQLDLELVSFRDALDWSLGHQPETALQLAASLWWFWFFQGYWSEGRGWLKKALDAPIRADDPSQRVAALNASAALAWWQGDLETARNLSEESVTLSRTTENQLGLAYALLYRGGAKFRQGDFAGAKSDLKNSLRIARKHENLWQVALTLMGYGDVASTQGDLVSGRKALAESLVVWRQLQDDYGIAYSSMYLGRTLIALGESEAARKTLEEGLSILHSKNDKFAIATTLVGLSDAQSADGNRALSTAYLKEALGLFRDLEAVQSIAESLERFIDVAIERGEFAWASKFLGAVDRMRKIIGVPLMPAQIDLQKRQLHKLQSVLPLLELSQYVSEGSQLPWEILVNFALTLT